MERIILHSDINSCYASIEHAARPELDGMPVAVGGSVEARHGIILAKDELAKRCGVRTGMVIWQAKQLCPELIVLPPRMDLYMQYSKRAQEIYSDYTNLREPFGIDESWLDVTGNIKYSDGLLVANEIKRRIKNELGITVSIGVSWNKVFAKLGSDYKKPDAITSISRDNFRELVWPQPVENLLYVGRATSARLRSYGIATIGELARADPEFLHASLGLNGYTVHAFANGRDLSPVRCCESSVPVKSVSNSTTTPRDMLCDEDVRSTLMALTESVASRLREFHCRGRCISLSLRSSALQWRSHQMKLPRSTNITKEIFQCGLELFRQMHSWPSPIHSIGICVSELVSDLYPQQTDMFGEDTQRVRQERLDRGIDTLRDKYGYACVRRGFFEFNSYSTASGEAPRAMPLCSLPGCH